MKEVQWVFTDHIVMAGYQFFFTLENGSNANGFVGFAMHRERGDWLM